MKITLSNLIDVKTNKPIIIQIDEAIYTKISRVARTAGRRLKNMLKSDKHYWQYCDLCRRDMVICGKCGNNTCNGGYGTLKDGSTCDRCPSAYDFGDEAEMDIAASS